MNYYNEFDRFPAQWLRNLSDAGHISKGYVDERSITDVKPEDLRGYAQCHFFAGIGVWSHALRIAGWGDDREVWTGSCPCQPFSAAGKRGGTADARHLWPEWFRLIKECRPRTIFGEQVASKDGLSWLDIVYADLESAGYTVGAVDICASGFGAPHIRQRLFFVADSSGGTGGLLLHGGESRQEVSDAGWSSTTRIVANSPNGNDRTWEPWGRGVGLEDDSTTRIVDISNDTGLQGDELGEALREVREPSRNTVGEPGPVNGFWKDAVWLPCRDGKARATGTRFMANTGTRNTQQGGASPSGCCECDSGEREAEGSETPGGRGGGSGVVREGCGFREVLQDGVVTMRSVESFIQPLAHGVAGRVGRLRAYGNAIAAPVAAEFIKAYMGG